MIFNVIDDDCAIKLRALNLMEVPWNSCQPPGIEAANTEHCRNHRAVINPHFS